MHLLLVLEQTLGRLNHFTAHVADDAFAGGVDEPRQMPVEALQHVLQMAPVNRTVDHPDVGSCGLGYEVPIQCGGHAFCEGGFSGVFYSSQYHHGNAF